MSREDEVVFFVKIIINVVVFAIEVFLSLSYIF
jgi:hypothetical protein